MNIFITGINGFIGSNLARYLLNMGHRISGSIRKTSNLSFLKDLQVSLFTGDISDEDFLLSCFKDQDIVYHVAALASDWAPRNTFYKINVQGTINVARAALSAKVKRLIFISSTAVYGLTGYRNRTEDDIRPKKNFRYASSKKEAEDWLRRLSVEKNLPMTIVQPANVFGPYDRTFFIKFASALEKRMMTFVNGGEAWTCPTYIENLTDALWLAATKKDAIGETFIISDGIDINWRQFIEKICLQLQVPQPRISFNFKLAYTLATLIEGIYKIFQIKKTPPITRYRICNVGRDYHFSIEKARNILGYSPRIDLDEAIRRTVQWYKEYKEVNG
jgi:nucleoside-diphosphate-sugar epimerase